MLLGASFDAQEDYIHPDTELPIEDPANPGEFFQSYVFQGRLANAFLGAMSLDSADGEASPSAADRVVLAGLVGPTGCGVADFTGDGALNFFDVSAFLTAFGDMDSAADINDDNALNFFDVSDFLGAFAAGCP